MVDDKKRIEWKELWHYTNPVLQEHFAISMTFPATIVKPDAASLSVSALAK